MHNVRKEAATRMGSCIPPCSVQRLPNYLQEDTFPDLLFFLFFTENHEPRDLKMNNIFAQLVKLNMLKSAKL
jgi:hypothetical protein